LKRVARRTMSTHRNGGKGKGTAGIEIVRVYEDPGRQGDYRALIDRLWPRGIRKSDLDVDEWAKDLAPSSVLRTWYGHDPKRFATFARRYRRELAVDLAAQGVEHLRQIAVSRQVTLLTATRDLEHSGATVLRNVIAGLTR
jgi:uncharacterized protein YeaO (DUF488 family)